MVIGQAAIDGQRCELAVMDFAFMGGSMGSVVGEKFSRACESAAERGVPLVSVTRSGGARMQEGILALMQLPKTVAPSRTCTTRRALISVLAHPTTAACSRASRASATCCSRSRRADVVRRPARRAADDAREAARRLRPRRVEPPLRPLDAIVPRPSCADVARCCGSSRECRVRPSSACASAEPGCERHAARRRALSGELERLQRQLERIEREPTDEEIWRSVELARHEERPYTLDYVERLLEDWFELHGDRGRADDARIVAGLGSSTGARSRSSASRRAATSRSAPSATSGWRTRRATARRCARWSSPTARLPARLASSTRRAPIRASRPSSTARAARSRARRRDGALAVPTVACVIGEGGSGGAVAIAVADRC
jgi:acetyl-CoA carboxylase carboxyl transferase subunit beta